MLVYLLFAVKKYCKVKYIKVRYKDREQIG